MKLDLADFGIEEEVAEQADEEEVEEVEEQEEAEEAPKAEAPRKIDHSIPARKRIADEREKLKFESVVFGDMQRQAAKIIGDLVLQEFKNYPEREHEWDYNEWTLMDFITAFADKAKAECQKHGGQALFAGNTDDPDDPTMNIIRSIIHTKNEPKKATAPKASASSKAKPKKEAKPSAQLHLDLGDF